MNKFCIAMVAIILGVLVGDVAPGCAAASNPQPPPGASELAAPVLSEPVDKKILLRRGETLSLAIGVTTSDPSLTLQWRHNGRPVPGATSDTLSAANVSQRNAGWYDLVATGATGETLSSVFFVIVAPKQPEVISWVENTAPMTGDIVAVSSDYFSIMALRSDGSISTSNAYGGAGSQDYPSSPLSEHAVSLASNYGAPYLLQDDLSVLNLYDGSPKLIWNANYVAILPSDTVGGYYYYVRRDGTVLISGFFNPFQFEFRILVEGLGGLAGIGSTGYRFDALSRDGICTSYGHLNEGEARPDPVENASKVFTTASSSFVLKDDGTVVKMGPTATVALATDVVDINGDSSTALALRSDGSVVVLEGTVPAEIVPKLNSVVALSPRAVLRDKIDDLPVSITQQPANLTMALGGEIHFSVQAQAGASYLIYQWRRNGVPIDKATGSALVLEKATVLDEGTYDVVVTSSLGSVTSDPASLTIEGVPQLVSKSPGVQNVVLGASADLSVVATGHGTLHYQWYLNALPVTGETAATLHFDHTTASSYGAYSVDITDDTGTRTEVLFLQRDYVKTQLMLVGNFSPSVEARISFGTDGIRLRSSQLIDRLGAVHYYDWSGRHDDYFQYDFLKKPVYDITQTAALYRDGSVGLNTKARIPLQRELANVIALSGGSTFDVALKADGTLISWDSRTFEKVSTPAFTQRVTAISASDGYALALLADGTVRAWGTGVYGETQVPEGLSHVVRVNALAMYPYAVKDTGEAVIWGMAFAVHTSLNHVLDVKGGTVLHDDGTVTDLIFGTTFKSGGTAFSIDNTAFLRDATLNTAPVVDQQPVSVTLGEGRDVMLTVHANAGTNYVEYQWRKNGIPIQGQTSNTLVFAGLANGDAGNYDVVVRNDLGTVTSDAAVVSVLAGPVISSASDVNRIVPQGNSLVLSVTASGSGALTYQWYKDNVALPGATGSSYTVASMGWLDAGRYRVTVSDNVGVALRLFNVGYAAAHSDVVLFANQNAPLQNPEVLGAIADLKISSPSYGTYHARVLAADGSLHSWKLDDPSHLTIEPARLTGVAYLTDNGLALKPDGTAVSITTGADWTNAASSNWVEITGNVGLAPNGRLYTLDGSVSASLWRPLGNVVAAESDRFGHISLVLGDGNVYEPSQTLNGYSAENYATIAGTIKRAAGSIVETTDGKLWDWSGSAPHVYLDDVSRWSVNQGYGFPPVYAIKQNGEAYNFGLVLSVYPHAYGISNYETTFHGLVRDTSSDVAPVILEQPHGVQAGEGAIARFGVTINSEALRCLFRWRKNGVEIPGATSAVFTLSNVSSSDVGDYDVVIANGAGSVTSSTASLSLLPLPTISATRPVRQLIKANAPLDLSVTATGVSEIHYQWFYEGRPIYGATSASYHKDRMALSDSGLYRVEATDSNGTNALLMRAMYVPDNVLITSTGYDSGTYQPTIENTIYSVSLAGTRFYIAYGDGSGISWPERKAELEGVLKWSRSVGSNIAAVMLDGHVKALTDPVASVWTDLGVTDCVDAAPVAVEGSGAGWLVLHSNGVLESVNANLQSQEHVQSFWADGGTGRMLWTRWNGSLGAYTRSGSNDVNWPLDVNDAAGIAHDGVLMKRDGSIVGWGPWTKANGTTGGTKLIVDDLPLFSIFLVGVKDMADELATEITGANQYRRLLDASGFVGLSLLIQDATPDPVPAISTQPVSVVESAGGDVILSASVSGEGLSFQWYKDGVAVEGATAATFTLHGIQNADAGRYTLVATNAFGSVTSRPAVVTLGEATPSHLINLSVRTTAGIEGNPLIVGFVTSGGSKQVLVRAIGPGLSAFDVPGTLPNPGMWVHATVNNADAVVASNDNWGANGAAADLSTLFASIGAFALSDETSKDAALTTTVDGSRTVHVNSVEAAMAGTVLVELYDADPSGASRLINVSARNRASNTSGTLIAGFVINGTTPKKVLIRGVGPTLAEPPFFVSGTLSDPVLELHTTILDSENKPVDTVVARNDDWSSEPGAAEAFLAAGAFRLVDQARDATVVVTLPAGAYTAVLSSYDPNDAGEALVEVYEVP